MQQSCSYVILTLVAPFHSLFRTTFQKGLAAHLRDDVTNSTMQDNLTLSDKPAPSNGVRPSTRPNNGATLPPRYSAVSRGENVPPRAPLGHRPSRSQEEAMRARRAGPSTSGRSHPTPELDIFADPSESPKRSEARRIRRNSESSVADRKPLDPEEEKKRQERRRRERRHRDREGSSSRSKKPDRKLDIIDKLDVTSIYGTGRECFD